MKGFSLCLMMLFVAVLAISHAPAQSGPGPNDMPCSDAPTPPNNGFNGCAPGLNLPSGQFTATPFVDAVCTNGVCPDYGDPDHNTVSLYGSFGNNEKTSSFQIAKDHYQKGKDLADQIKPLCTNGSEPVNNNCPDGKPPAIIGLVLGFSNCDIEVCGGNSDAWDKQRPASLPIHLPGQPCATRCPNKGNPDFPNPWNQVTSQGGDGVTQRSFLYQVYPPSGPSLVGSHVVVFNGAHGQATLDKWDPTEMGYYWTHNCPDNQGNSDDPECNYTRVRGDLTYNGFNEKQVQVVFLKASNSYPQCDLKGLYCAPGALPDAYVGEQHLGNILRYLKCCTLDTNGNPTNVPRYPKLKQVFLTSRTYGGYANGTAHGCLMPEPFAYEHGLTVQRLIVAQIKQAAYPPIPIDDIYAGSVDYNFAPWFDWGPYLWASGQNFNAAGVNWCNGQVDPPRCSQNDRDFRDGDLDHPEWWGDYTHPSAKGAEKVANQLVKFITGQLPSPQTFISEWVTPWRMK